jgi:microcystin-dependent protein
MMVTITPGTLPMPNSITTGTRYTKAGVVCIASSTGRMMRCARSLLASSTPSGSPMTMQNTSEVSTSDSVTIASGQMPSMATSSSATVVPTASARPANCQASRPMRAIIASVGRPVSRPCTQFSVLSMGRRTV